MKKWRLKELSIVCIKGCGAIETIIKKNFKHCSADSIVHKSSKEEKKSITCRRSSALLHDTRLVLVVVVDSAVY